MVTIYDIARKAGVSAATVSKALNGRHDVNDITRSHVIAAASELGYTPNAHARSLKMKKSWLIGVVYSAGKKTSLPLDHPLFLPLLDSFKKRVEEKGYELLFFSDNSPLVGDNMIAHSSSRQVDGVLLVNVDNVDAVAIKAASEDIPMVSCNLILDGIASVVTENIESTKEAVRYLYSLGHRRIAHVAGMIREHVLAANERLQAYKEALQELGLPYDENLVVTSDTWEPEAGERAMENLLSKDDSFTAIYFASDSLMMGALPVLKAHGKVVPEDVSVIGFDGARWTEYLGGGYTTFKQQTDILGQTSADILLEKIDGIPCSDIVRVPAELIIRRSCKKLNYKMNNKELL